MKQILFICGVKKELNLLVSTTIRFLKIGTLILFSNVELAEIKLILLNHFTKRRIDWP